jgi:hypothetical protein
LFASVCVATHVPVQQVFPPLQGVPQAPQFVLSALVSVHRPAQQCFPLAVQSSQVPTRPQCVPLWPVTQVPLAQQEPAGQADWHWPPLQHVPVGHWLTQVLPLQQPDVQVLVLQFGVQTPLTQFGLSGGHGAQVAPPVPQS